jgi:hypothetical protein
VQLKAIAPSVKPGGRIGALKAQGRIHTAGDDVVSVEIEGYLDQLTLAGGISAAGIGSDAVQAGGEFTDITLTSEHGKTLVHTTA